VELLVQEGYPVRATVRSPEKAGVLPASVEQARADLSDEDALANAMEGCEGVFHYAAALGATWEAAREANVEGTRRVLRAAQRAGVRRVVYTSSSAAIIQADGLVSENAPNATALVDPYSVTKAEAEGVIFDAVREGIDARIVNVTNAYGPSPRGPYSYNQLFLASARGNVDVIVNAQVGWVLAEDVSRGHLLAYEKGEAGKRYLLCGEVATFPTVLGRFAELWGSPHVPRVLPAGTDLGPDGPQFARRSEVYGKLGGVRLDDANARAVGWQGRGIEEGLRITVDWLKAMGEGRQGG
jgi:dihydroflavonol-4-reductase